MEAQHRNDSLPIRDFGYIANRSPWLQSNNAAGLTTFEKANISRAATNTDISIGGLVDYYQSPHTTKIGAEAESLYRLNQRTVVYGKITYNHIHELDIAGSAFMNLYHIPFNIVESTDDNKGAKSADHYHLIGAIGVKIWKELSLGTKLSFKAGNKAKYKDLRTKNKAMELQATIGSYYPIASWLAIGANYEYRRSIESLLFSTYGTTDRTYNSLIDYGTFLGIIEPFSNTGFTSSAQENPLFNEYHGGGVQIDLRFSPINIYNSFEVNARHGYYGKNSPNTITFTHHDGKLYHYEGMVEWKNRSHIQQLHTDILQETVSNYRYNYRSETNQAGSNHYTYYGSNKTADKRWLNGNIGYKGYYYIEGDLPRWTIDTGIKWHLQEITVYFFPLSRTQHSYTNEIYGYTSHNLLLHTKSMLTFSLGGLFSWGSRNTIANEEEAKDRKNKVNYETMERYAQREEEFQQRPQYALHCSVRYTLPFKKAKLNSFIELYTTYRKANGTITSLEGNHNNTFGATIGCIF